MLPDALEAFRSSLQDALSEQAYLVARGCRPLAILGNCAAEPYEMGSVQTEIERVTEPNCIPFVLDHGDGVASFGYAARAWVIDLYAWTLREAPESQTHRIVGLLLGYDPAAICRHEELRRGRWRAWESSTASSASRGSS